MPPQTELAVGAWLLEKNGGIMMGVFEKASVEYLISRHLLKQLLAKELISQDEFERIDAENKKSFDSN